MAISFSNVRLCVYDRLQSRFNELAAKLNCQIEKAKLPNAATQITLLFSAKNPYEEKNKSSCTSIPIHERNFEFSTLNESTLSIFTGASVTSSSMGHPVLYGSNASNSINSGASYSLEFNSPRDLSAFKRKMEEIKYSNHHHYQARPHKNGNVACEEDQHDYDDADELSGGGGGPPSQKSPRTKSPPSPLCKSRDKAVVATHTSHKKSHADNVFDRRTEKASANQYFQFYAYLSQQQNMMQDFVRTATYQQAILLNSQDFADKVVLDVGAGSGILSFFAAQAGAKCVYAVEASNMAKYCAKLVKANGFADKIVVLAGKLEELEIPEPVDVLISEPMGYALVNERMLETYLYARRFLRPSIAVNLRRSAVEEGEAVLDGASGAGACGVMFPSTSFLYVAPFSDEALYSEIIGKANFWHQNAFYGLDLTSNYRAANLENLSQPIVDTFHIDICVAPPVKHVIDFRSAAETQLEHIEIPLHFEVNRAGLVHGLALWFDVAFVGSSKTVWLSTSPTQPLTHWYQVRCLFTTPLFVPEHSPGGVTGVLRMCSNERQSYDMHIELCVPETNTRVSNSLDLKNPYFHYSGQPVTPPIGSASGGSGGGAVNTQNAATNQIAISTAVAPPTDVYYYAQPQQQQQNNANSMQYVGGGGGGGAMNVGAGMMEIASPHQQYQQQQHNQMLMMQPQSQLQYQQQFNNCNSAALPNAFIYASPSSTTLETMNSKSQAGSSHTTAHTDAQGNGVVGAPIPASSKEDSASHTQSPHPSDSVL